MLSGSCSLYSLDGLAHGGNAIARPAIPFWLRLRILSIERMRMPAPEILVVLPTLGDRLDTLRESIESVNAQRSTTSLTLAVVAPRRATEARAMAASLGALVVDDPAEGISAAINQGLAARTTEQYYAWVGDDDLFRPRGLARCRTFWTRARSRARVRRVRLHRCGGPHDHREQRRPPCDLPAAVGSGPDPPSRHHGAPGRSRGDRRVRPSLKYAMDLDAFLKLRAHGRFAWTRASVSAFRWHADSLTVANRRPSSLESESVKRRHLPRALRPVSALWTYPIRWASAVAASGVNARARTVARNAE